MIVAVSDLWDWLKAFLLLWWRTTLSWIGPRLRAPASAQQRGRAHAPAADVALQTRW